MYFGFTGAILLFELLILWCYKWLLGIVGVEIWLSYGRRLALCPLSSPYLCADSYWTKVFAVSTVESASILIFRQNISVVSNSSADADREVSLYRLSRPHLFDFPEIYRYRIYLQYRSLPLTSYSYSSGIAAGFYRLTGPSREGADRRDGNTPPLCSD